MNSSVIMHIACFAMVNLLVIVVGYWLVRYHRALISWLLLISSIAVVYLVTFGDHPIFRMLAIIATTFSGMKVIAVTEEYKCKLFELTFKQWFIYALGWVGMRAQPFEKVGSSPVSGGKQMVKFGISRIIIGVSLIMLGKIYLRLNARQRIRLSVNHGNATSRF